MKFITLSGKAFEAPEWLQKDHASSHHGGTRIKGLDPLGRIVVFSSDLWGDDTAPRFLFGLSLCCNAFDKGVETGVVCRRCYGPESGSYLFRAEDGSYPGLDPLVSALD